MSPPGRTAARRCEPAASPPVRRSCRPAGVSSAACRKWVRCSVARPTMPGRAAQDEGRAAVETEQVAQALARTELFADIDETSLKGLAAAATVQERKAGERLFEVGDPGDELYVVVEGSVRFSVTSKQGEEVLLSELHAPEAFGELALVQGGVRSARADVGHDAVLVTVSRAQLLD